MPRTTSQLSEARAPRLLLSPKQASEFLGVPEGTLAQWRSQRRGPPYIKLEGRLVRYRSSDLEDYLSGHRVGTDLICSVPSGRLARP
jgi:predicted DNA-binding transcriptional regulator AlpA